MNDAGLAWGRRAKHASDTRGATFTPTGQWTWIGLNTRFSLVARLLAARVE